MKIAVIGTHSVGKTTLCGKLFQEYTAANENVILIPEAVRDSPFGVNADFNEKCALWTYHTQIKRELEAQLRYRIVITDRSAIDSLIYARALGIRSSTLTACFAAACEWLKTYDTIVHVAMSDYEIQADGFRSVDPEFQRSVQRAFEEWLKEDGKNYQIHYTNSNEIFSKKGEIACLVR